MLGESKMSDLISRKTALERAEACKFTDKNEKRKFMDWLNYCLDAAIEPQWIPCSERLPEEGGEYLVTAEDYTTEVIVLSYDADASDWSDYFDNMYDEVIAWMPLPEPYKGE